MSKIPVYFTDMHASYGNSMLDKFKNLILASDMLDIDFNHKLVALKIHFGEYGNLAFIKPNYVKVIADIIKEKGGQPFLTDASTLYSGTRSDAVSHLNTAHLNGFTKETTGCYIVIADGLKGNDFVPVPVDLKHCSSVKIATAIMEADVIISLSHFKGHEQAGFGGTLKNLGMGCGSKLGKLEMHSGSKPIIDIGKCIACGMCVKNCNQEAISIVADKAKINYQKCVGCGECIVVCPKKAISQQEAKQSRILNEKIVEYTYGIIQDKPHYHFNFIMNVSPDCDCFPANDLPIVPDIGITASADPVAIDMASVDLVNKASIIKNSVLDKNKDVKKDKFKCIHPNVDWQSGLKYAEELKLGTMKYELIIKE